MERRRSNRSTGSITISTVAERAGVSEATVSRVMNGIPTVDRSLVQRVKAAAAEVGYRPNIVARGLARGSLQTLGVVVPNLANPYFYQILKAIEASARSHDFRMLIADSDEDPDEELAICRWLATQVDSIILCSSRMSAEQLMEVKGLVRSLVLTNRREESVPIAAVCADVDEAIQSLTTYLADQGHARAAYLAGPSLSWANRDRLRALTATTSLKITPIASGGTIEDGYNAVPEALDTKPTVIVAFNDLVAFGALRRLKELGVGVPEDVSLAGFDDIPFSSYASPPLTSIKNPHELLGTYGWELAERQLKGEPESTVTLVTSQLVLRGSTGPVTTGS